jgi:predicted amidohydrolase
VKVRIATIQYMLRPIADWRDFERQVRFVLGAAAEYRPHFVLLPEIFTTQLLSALPRQEVHAAVRSLHQFTSRYHDLMREHAERGRYYLVAGSHPTIREGKLYNTSYLFTPRGEMHSQDKTHRTRWEREQWKTTPGDSLRLFETEFGDLSILVCYDVEFPELARMVCDAGSGIAPRRRA